MRVITPKHIADRVEARDVPAGQGKKRVSRAVALAVLAALWECDKRNTRIVWPRIFAASPDSPSICRTTGYSRSTVIRALHALEAQGLIVPLGPRHGGRRIPTTWGLVDNPVDNDGNRVLGTRLETPETVSWGPLNRVLGTTKPCPGDTRIQERREERMEERSKKHLPPRRREPDRACRYPGCNRPARVYGDCLRHAAGLPIPPTAPPDDPQEAAPSRREAVA